MSTVKAMSMYAIRTVRTDPRYVSARYAATEADSRLVDARVAFSRATVSGDKDAIVAAALEVSAASDECQKARANQQKVFNEIAATLADHQ